MNAKPGRKQPNSSDYLATQLPSVDMGLVEKDTIDKRTNSYTITQRGRREIEARHEWESQYVTLDA